MRYLGIDYGKKRVGIAISDENGQFALAHSVLQNDWGIMKRIKEICDQKKVEAIVIGESKDYKGLDNPIMKDIEGFKKELSQLVRAPIYMEPEFMTSAEAEHIQGKTDLHDASAAALILKSYLDKKANMVE